MRAKITSVSELNERKQVVVVFDILADSSDDLVAGNQSLVGQPSEVEELIKEVLRDYEAESELASQLKVGQVIESSTEG